MDNYIMINGKRIELTDEQIKSLSESENEPKNPFERAEFDNNYFYIESDGTIEENNEDNCDFDATLYSVANYCTDENLMKQRALHEILNRLLWRFTYENGWSDDLWNNGENENYNIFQDTYSKKFLIDSTYLMHDMQPYFITRKIAERAIKEIIEPFMDEHPEFVW